MSDEPISVVPHDLEWQHRFAAERLLLERVLAPWLDEGVHHVGSTSIRGIAAKPCIDMIAGVRDFEEARTAYEPLQTEGYIHAPHRPGIAHHFYKPTSRRPERTYSLHLTLPGSDLWRERLSFRDALRNDHALAGEYEQLKLRLAKEYPDDLGSYTGGKREFVVGVLAQFGIQLGRR